MFRNSGVSEQPKVLAARDVTVMRIADGVFGVLSTTGDRNLGGFDMMDEALEDAGLSYADIDRVLLVGGSTRMPMVDEPVTRVTGKQPELSVKPDETVALGAAIQAEMVAAGSRG